MHLLNNCHYTHYTWKIVEIKKKKIRTRMWNEWFWEWKMPPTYLKKSVRQKSFPSLEKHFSARVFWQSQHFTHFACQALSSTFRRNRSRMGESQPAHNTILMALDPLRCCLNRFQSARAFLHALKTHRGMEVKLQYGSKSVNQNHILTCSQI